MKAAFLETEYTKNLIEIEYSSEDKYSIDHKTFSNYQNMGEYSKRLQNSTKNNKLSGQ